MDPTAILIVIIILAALFLLPKLRMRQGVSQVINLLLKHGATSPATAKTREELGFPPTRVVPKENVLGQGGIFGQTNYKAYTLEISLERELFTRRMTGNYGFLRS